jgi:Mg-chelatase subunit ChlD
LLTFAQTEWLWLLLALPVIPLLFLRSRAGLDRWRWWAALIVRCATAVCLVLALAEPHYVRRCEGVTVIFAVDRSHSIPAELQQKAHDYIQAASKQARPGDRVGIISFDGDAQVDLLPRPRYPEWIPFGTTDDPDRTDISSALRLCMALFPSDTARRIVLLTDGNENTGHLLREMEAAAASRVPIDVVPLEYDAEDEMMVDRLVAPSRARPDSQIELRAVLRSRRPGRARLTCYHNDTLVEVADPIVPLSGNMKPDPVTIPFHLVEGGMHRFEVRLAPVNGSKDTFVENNRGSAFTVVQSEGMILVLSAPGSRSDQPLVQALRDERFAVDAATTDDLAIDLAKLDEYSVVVFGNMSADCFTDRQQQALATYVRDLGGGLILTGGNEAFGAGGWTGTPVEEISPVAFSLPPHIVKIPSALVIVLDRSGSMASPVSGSTKSQQQIANDAAVLALRSLLPQDQVGLVAFESSAEWVVPIQPNTDSAGLARRIRSIVPGGGTNIYPGLEMAGEALSRISGTTAIKHIILLSDGQSAPGPFDRLASRLAGEGITISTIGVGDAVNDPVLKQIAVLGGGEYHPVRNPNVLPKLFLRETRLFRDRLVSEDPFVPAIGAAHSPILAGFRQGAFPELGGFVRTRPRVDATVALVHQGETDPDPLLAHWHCGTGRVVAFTSGWWPKWGHGWTEWSAFSAFWGQVIGWTMSDREAEGFEVTTRVEGDRGQIIVEAVGEDLSFINGLDIGGVVVPPDYEGEQVRLKQTGPGRYEAEFNAREAGNYLIHMRARGPGAHDGVIRAGLSVSYSAEFRELSASRSGLTRLAERTAGTVRQVSSLTDDPFTRDLPDVTTRRPIWQWVIAWGLVPLFLLDVAVRRLASTVALSVYVELTVLALLIGLCHLTEAGAAGYVLAFVLAEAIGWAMRRSVLKAALGYLLTPAVAAGAAPVEALGRLRRSREQLHERFDETHGKAASEESQPRAQPSWEPPERTQDWTAGQTDDAPGLDTLGPGAAESSNASDRQSAREKQPDQPGIGSLTGRLRDVKRQVRQRLGESQQDNTDKPDTE